MHKRVHIIRDNKKLISNQTLEVVTSLSHNQGVLGSSPSGTTLIWFKTFHSLDNHIIEALLCLGAPKHDEER